MHLRSLLMTVLCAVAAGGAVCPEDSLMSMLDNKEYPKMAYIMTRQSVFDKIASGELGCRLIVFGLVATEGEWRRRYMGLLERNKRGEYGETLRVLMKEMWSNE